MAVGVVALAESGWVGVAFHMVRLSHCCFEVRGPNEESFFCALREDFDVKREPLMGDNEYFLVSITHKEK